MTIQQYQYFAQRTSNEKLTQQQHLMNGLLGLAGETGECCDLAKKHFYQDNREIREHLLEELGDVLWYVAEAASALDARLEDIAADNIKKLEKRYPQGFEAERSLHRE